MTTTFLDTMADKAKADKAGAIAAYRRLLPKAAASKLTPDQQAEFAEVVQALGLTPDEIKSDAGVLARVEKLLKSITPAALLQAEHDHLVEQRREAEKAVEKATARLGEVRSTQIKLSGKYQSSGSAKCAIEELQKNNPRLFSKEN